jgi:hypothetical protein
VRGADGLGPAGDGRVGRWCVSHRGQFPASNPTRAPVGHHPIGAHPVSRDARHPPGHAGDGRGDWATAIEVHRAWRPLGQRLHRTGALRPTGDPHVIEGVRDVVGLPPRPPGRAIAPCVDDESWVQDLDRARPVPRMRPGRPSGGPTDTSATGRPRRSGRLRRGRGSSPLQYNAKPSLRPDRGAGRSLPDECCNFAATWGGASAVSAQHDRRQ